MYAVRRKNTFTKNIKSENFGDFLLSSIKYGSLLANSFHQCALCSKSNMVNEKERKEWERLVWYGEEHSRALQDVYMKPLLHNQKCLAELGALQNRIR